MKKIHIENIVLVILIISSIFLTGSLWFDNYHGLSLVMSELPIWINETFDFNRFEYTEFIKPFKVTLTNSETGNYSYYAFSEGNAAGLELIKSVVTQIPGNATMEIAFIDEWNELKNRKSVICEFGGGIDVEILKSIIPSKLIYSDKITNISDIAITKSVNGLYIYIKESNDTVYRISADIDVTGFSSYMSAYSNGMTYTKLVKLEDMGTTVFYGNKKIAHSSMVLFPVSTKQSNRRVVSEINKKEFYDTHDIDEIEKIADLFFSTYEYTKFTTTDNNYIFIKDDGSTIKIFNDGIFEYTSKVSEEESESTIISAFNVALEYINKINGVENIYLISANEVDSCYEFEFGLNIDDLPVINSDSKINDDNRVHIFIKIYNDKVVYYKELANRYDFSKINSYISVFGHNILDNLLAGINKDETVNIERLELVYDISSDSKLPAWYTVYQTDEKEDFIITSAAKKRKY